jgi:ABC-type nitrate/sulfonate/bicarbonate transport system substrate-binding protein
MNRWLGRGLTALLLGLSAGTAAAAPMPHIVVGIPTESLTASQSYLGDALGVWKKRGLDVTIKYIKGIGATNAVIAHSIDFTNTSSSVLVRAVAKGQKVEAIAVTIDQPIPEIVMRKDVAAKRGISFDQPFEKRAKSLKGLTVAVESINSVIHGYLRMVAHRAGLDADTDLRVTPMAPPNMLAAMKSHAIDAFIMSPPWPQTAIAEGMAVPLVSSIKGDLPKISSLAYNLVLARDETCTEKPDICRKLVEGYAEVMDYMREHPKESLAILQKRFKQIPPKVLQASFEIIREAMPKTPLATATQIENAITFNREAGLIPKDQKLPATDVFYTNKFAKQQ